MADYHFKITIYKDLPLIIPFAWGMMFALTTYLSEKLYSRLFHKTSVLLHDKRILILDLLIGLCVGFPLETVGTHAGVWNYNATAIGWTLGTIPLFQMPWETLISYALIMLIGPTFVRYWQAAFEGRI